MSGPSLRRTLLIRCGLAVGALLCLLSFSVHQFVRASLYQELDQSLAQSASLLANQVELENGRVIHEWQEGLSANSVMLDGLFQFWDLRSGVTTRSPALGIRDLPRFQGADGEPEIRNIHLPGHRRGRAIGMRIFPFVLPEEIARMQQRGDFIDAKSLPLLLVVARDVESIHRTLDRLDWALAGGTLLTLALGFLVIRRVVLVTLRPIDELTREIQQRSDQQLDAALVMPRKLPSELAGLAGNFDSLLARVAVVRQREKDFVRHAAHELRTPIAGLRATTDLALSQPRDAATYAGHLTTCQKTAQELGELVKRLSALARVGQAATSATCETVDVADLLRQCLEPLLPRFEDSRLRIASTFPGPPPLAYCNPMLLRIIVNNLLDNAICYATPGTEVILRAETTGDRVTVKLTNQAASLPENPERLFEPLFRNDDSAAKASGQHLGIGLTLSLEAAQAMDATLQARTINGGIEFLLRLPRDGR